MAKKFPTTESEKLFQQYLETHRLRNYEYEPLLPESKKPPDFLLPFAGTRILFQLKEFDPNRVPTHLSGGAVDPYRPISERIQEAWEQLKDFPNDCCCIVLYDVRGRAHLHPQTVYGAMLGKLGISVPLDPNRGLLSEKSTFGIFQPGGEMVWDYGEPHKTNISAIVILEHLEVGQQRFLAETASRDRKLTPEQAFVETFQTCERTRGTKRDVSLREVRVVVCENPHVKRLPKALFTGPYDERYGLSKGKIKRLFVGRELRKLEAREGKGARSPISQLIQKSMRKRLAVSRGS